METYIQVGCYKELTD